MHKKFEKIGEKRKRQKEDFERALVREREREKERKKEMRDAQKTREPPPPTAKNCVGLASSSFDDDDDDDDDDDANTAYASLLSRWPARKKHIDFLVASLGGFSATAKKSFAPNVHVHGPPCGGKTMLVRDVFDVLHAQFGFAYAYVNCVDAHDKKLMFEALLEQLQPYFKDERRRRMLRERARAMANEKEMRDTEEEKENEGDQNNKTDDVEGYEAEREARMAKNAERMKSTGVDDASKRMAEAGNGKRALDDVTAEKEKTNIHSNNKSSVDQSTTTSLALVSAAVVKNTSSANRRKRKRAIHVADFVQVLKENLDRNGPRITIVLDDAHRLAEQKDDRFLPTLLKIGELTKRNIHVVTISCESIQTFQTTVDLVKPQTIFFGAYTKKELIEVLLKEAPRDIAKERYRAFLDPMVAAFYDTCRAPRELRTALEPLWKRYSEKLYEAIRNGTPENELPEPRRLYANLMSAKKNREPTGPSQEQNYAQKQQQQQAKIHAGLTVPLSKANLALQRGEWPVPEERYFTGEAVLEDATGDAANTTNTSYIAKALDFDIPKLTKFLLLSAYIVSKNDESVDNRLFATEGAVGNHRKRGRLAHDRNVDRAARRSLEDTNAFKLERLLSVFQHIVRRSYEEGGSDLADLEEELLSADVFTQISSATSLGLLVSSQGDAMCGGKYRSCVSDELAEKLSRNLSVDLKHYIHYI